MTNKKILVTGGAGYIGSHVVRQLGEAGESVITLDNLSTGFEAAVTAGELVIGDTGDETLLAKLFDEHEIDTVMHFAAHTIVPESVSDPLKYYRNNTANSCSRPARKTACATWCFPPRPPSTDCRPRAKPPRTRRRCRLTRTGHLN